MNENINKYYLKIHQAINYYKFIYKISTLFILIYTLSVIIKKSCLLPVSGWMLSKNRLAPLLK